MLQKNAGTQNEGGRDTKANVEEVDETRIEDKRETKTEGEKKTELRVRPCAWGSYVQDPCGTRGYTRVEADHRIIVETMEVLRREYESKSSGCRGGSKTRNANVGSKTRNAKMVQKVEGPRQTCHGSS